MARDDFTTAGRRRGGRDFERGFRRRLHRREVNYFGPYEADYRSDRGEPVDQRPYEYGRGSRAWPETGRGLSAGGRQGPGRAWGMGGHPELASESDRYGAVAFDELHASGMGILHGPDWRWAQRGREGRRAESSWPHRTVGVGPVRAGGRRGGGGLPDTHPGAEDWGHVDEIPGTRYLYESAYRARPGGARIGGRPYAAGGYGGEYRGASRSRRPHDE